MSLFKKKIAQTIIKANENRTYKHEKNQIEPQDFFQIPKGKGQKLRTHQEKSDRTLLGG